MPISNALVVRVPLPRALFLSLASISVAFGCASPSRTPAPAAVTTARAIAPAPAPAPIRPAETFDAVWTTVRDSHFDKDLNGVDWNAVRDELRPKALAATTQDESRAIQLEMLSRLGQSHFVIIPRQSAEQSPAIDTPEEQIAAPLPTRTATNTAAATATNTASSTSETTVAVETRTARAESSTSTIRGVSGLDIAFVEGEPTVLRVAPHLGGSRANVHAGWTLISVDGMRTTDVLRPMRDALALEADLDSQHARALRMELAHTSQALLQGNTGQTSSVVFADAAGSERTVTLTFDPAPYGSTQFGNLPPLPVEVDTQLIELAQGESKPVRIGVIGFNIWMTGASPAIDKAVDEYRSCDGIVLDLRGNPGGVGAMSMGVAGHFLTESASLGSMIGRETTLEFKASPRKVSTAGKRVRPFSKPLAILVDGRSASTSEVFAGGLQDLGRARVFGETSAGMALPAVAVELPSGDVLMHAVADFVTTSGTRIEGRGIVPNELVVPTRAALCEGRDPALNAAAEWIAATTLVAREAKRLKDAAKASDLTETVTAGTSIPAPLSPR